MAKQKQVRCGNCKKYFDEDTIIKLGITRFCSWDCVNAKKNAQKAKNKDKPPLRQQSIKPKGIKPKPKKSATDFPPEVRERIFKRDRYRCGLCGKSSGNLVIHHIHYRSEKLPIEELTSPYNGVTLCNEPCHLSIVHRDKKTWQPRLKELVKKREEGGGW